VGLLIQKLGTKYSRLRPRLYTIIFCTCDVIALVVQSVGGAAASEANTASGAATGGHIALGGIAFQFAGIVVFMLLSAEFFIRFLLKKPFPGREDTLNNGSLSVLDPKIKQMIFGVSLSTLTMFIRGVYRTIELANGWGGRIISTQSYFIALDGSMILLALLTLNIFHPGRLLDEQTVVEENKNGSVTEA